MRPIWEDVQWGRLQRSGGKMKTTPEFIELLKAKHGLKSNYAVAKFLGQTDTAVARWSHGKGSFSDETAMAFADLLDIDPAYVVACMHAERAKHAKEKQLWERIATTMTGLAAGLAIMLILPTFTLPEGAANLAFLGFTSPSLYIMSNQFFLYSVLFSVLCLSCAAFIMKRHNNQN